MIEYQKLMAGSIEIDLSESALEEAVRQIGPAFIYSVHVSVSGRLDAQRLLTRLRMDYKENPFSPYFNIIVDTDLERDEWCLEANGMAFGSRGA